ncbi:MAG: LytR C-terminal domain-containing protein, partial [Miltoncostaeaceae bacterium]
MSELLELLDRGPMIALAIAMVLMVAVVVVVVLQTRRIARLESMLAERGEAATDAPLRRIAELQARQEAAAGTSSAVALRPLLAVAAVVLVVVLAVGGGWFLLGGGGEGGANGPDGQAQAPPETETGATTAERTTTEPADPLEATRVPDEVPPLTDTSAYTVLVLNASGVAGAAGDGVAPRLQTEGFNLLQPDNYPSGENLDLSVVMYNGRENQEAAWSVADVLGIRRAP